MDEDKIQLHRREQDEKATQQRAAILGLQYLDMRSVEQTLPLTSGVLEVPAMYKGHVVPLLTGGGNEPFRFGVTSQTPQSLIRQMETEYNDRGDKIQFLLISASGFRAMMNRYDPPKKVIYDDIEIAKEGDSDTITGVSKTLNSVSSDQVFDYLIDQADRLNASDIHIENERTYIRIRMRIDGALHPVADLEKDRYRIIMGELASRANISSAAEDPQSGHMQKEITRGGSTHLLNLRVETVPTMLVLRRALPYTHYRPHSFRCFQLISIHTFIKLSERGEVLPWLFQSSTRGHPGRVRGIIIRRARSTSPWRSSPGDC